jgi:hypothetical protein
MTVSSTGSPSLESACSDAELKKYAEELAKIAVDDRIAIKQIRNLYEKSRNRGMEEFELFIKYQIGRTGDSRERPVITQRFGEKVLDLGSKCGKTGLIRLLRWTAMLYDYTRMNYSHQGSGTATKAITESQRRNIEELIRTDTSRYGFLGLNIEEDRGSITIRVKLARFYGNPADLSKDLATQLKSQVKELSNSFVKIWIEKEVR